MRKSVPLGNEQRLCVGELWDRSGLRLYDCSTREQEINGPLPPPHLVEPQRAFHRLGRRVALPLAEFLPVDVGLHRIDLLLDQPPHELLDAAIDLALEQRLR